MNDGYEFRVCKKNDLRSFKLNIWTFLQVLNSVCLQVLNSVSRC